MRRRGWAIAVVVVLVLAAVVVVGDLVARLTAEQRIAASAREALGASGETTVTTGGDRPLLLQAARGRLDEVRLTADRVEPGQGTTVTDVTVVATGVGVRPPHTAAEVTMTGTLPVEAIRDRIADEGLEVDVVTAGGGLRASGAVLGVAWGATLVPRVDGGRLLADVEAADLAGLAVGVDVLPAEVRDAFTGLEVPVSGLPDGLELAGAEVVARGVEVTVAGTDVPLGQ